MEGLTSSRSTSLRTALKTSYFLSHSQALNSTTSLIIINCSKTLPLKPYQFSLTLLPSSSIIFRFSGLSRVESSPMSVSAVENGSSELILPATNDAHGGVMVEMKDPMDSQVFVALLRASLLKWKQQGKKGVWIKLPIAQVNLVEPAVKEGFWYHHAEPSYVMLVHWIPEIDCTIPPNASHCVGVGAILFNDKNEVLVVQEKRGRFHDLGVWKIPTGVVDAGEDLLTAAIREVKEETGIEAEFVEVLAFRQAHDSFFGKSDLFFLCMLRPLSFEIKKQDLEIEAAQWMPFKEYAAQPFTQKHEPFKYLCELCLAKLEKHYIGFSPRPVSSYFEEHFSYMYLNTHDLCNNC